MTRLLATCSVLCRKNLCGNSNIQAKWHLGIAFHNSAMTNCPTLYRFVKCMNFDRRYKDNIWITCSHVCSYWVSFCVCVCVWRCCYMSVCVCAYVHVCECVWMCVCVCVCVCACVQGADRSVSNYPGCMQLLINQVRTPLLPHAWKEGTWDCLPPHQGYMRVNKVYNLISHLQSSSHVL